MSRRLFGTDGVRGVANQDLTPELALALGRAAAADLRDAGGPMRVVVGRDTRRSGPMLEAALAAGLSSEGTDVVSLGIVPTPVVSLAARRFGYGLGAVVSASHNPAPDNGIKLLGNDGRKLSDEREHRIESLMGRAATSRPAGAALGAISSDRTPVDAYRAELVGRLPERLDGMRVAVDAANGAAFELACALLEALGAVVVPFFTQPDGVNINLGCGATSPGTIQELTVQSGCDVGLAFDGDADRVVFSDEKGRLINGDRTMASWCAHWQSREGIMPPIVVGTVMSNTGFETYLSERGIRLERAAVGDKYVAQRMEQTGAPLGGEQSGHIIFANLGPTGDGLATALEFLRVLRRDGKPASTAVDEFENWPQLLLNVAVAARNGWADGPQVRRALAEAEEALSDEGRISARASGTQPVIRVMVEARRAELRDRVADSVFEALRSEVGGVVIEKVDLTHALGD